MVLTPGAEARDQGARRGPDPPRPPHRRDGAPCLDRHGRSAATSLGTHHRHAPVAAGPAESGRQGFSGGLQVPARLQGLRSSLRLHGLPGHSWRGTEITRAGWPEG